MCLLSFLAIQSEGQTSTIVKYPFQTLGNKKNHVKVLGMFSVDSVLKLPKYKSPSVDTGLVAYWNGYVTYKDSTGTWYDLGRKIDLIDSVKKKAGTDSVFYYKDGVAYLSFVDGGSGSGWSDTGNSGTTAGTNFIGTTDAVSFVVKTNNTERARVLSTGNVGIGLSSPAFKLDIGGTALVSDRKIGINSIQFGYIPDQTDFLGSLAIGTGLQLIIPGSGYLSKYNTTTGIGAGDSLTLGFFNTFNGSFSSHRGKYITETVSIGFNANRNNKGSYNVIAGSSAFLNCDSCETSNVIGNLAGYQLLTANQINVMGYRAMQTATDAHFTDVIGYRGVQYATSLIGVAAFGQNTLGSLLVGNGHSAFGAFTGGGATGGRYTSFFGYYSGNTVRQKPDAVNSTSIGAFSFATRDYETVIGSKDSTKHLWLYASDSLQANLVRTTSYGWVWAYDSATKNTRYMPTSSISGGGGGSGVTTLAAIGSSPNANGATISGSTLNLQPASASFGGVVTTGAQTIAGIKTHTDKIVVEKTPSGSVANFLQMEYTDLTVGSGASIQFSTFGGTLVGGFNHSRTGSGAYEFSLNNWDGASNAEIMRVKSDGGAGSNKLGIGNIAPTSTIHINGSVAAALTTVTSSTTATASHHTILADATSGNITITLPAASGCSGRIYIVKKIDSGGNSVTIDGNSSETIDGATTVSTSTQWVSFQIQSNGTEWYKLN